MKTHTKIALGAAVMSAGAAFAALAGSSSVVAQPPPFGMQMRGPNMCLNLTYLRRSRAIDNRTIIYLMTNGDIWRNTLAAPCPDLVTHAAGSYSQVSHDDWICGNTQQITVATGMVCRLGQFTRVN